jgi:dTDP-4-dehydrorhamnose reductase
MHILVTGGNGQLGNEMRQVAQNSTDHYLFTDVVAPEGVETTLLDITDLEAVRALVKKENISCIINCAAYTKVDKAETDEAFCEKLNADPPENLAKAMKEVGGLLVHISTDYVFGGDPYNTPCREEQKGTPTGVYGKTKLLGEQKIQATGVDYLIFRTAWLYSEYGKNFCKTMLNLTATKPALKVVFDQAGTPTYAYDLALAIYTIVNERKYEGNTGIYHYSNEGAVSWYDFAKAVCELSGNSCDIQPCHTAEFPSKARRPRFSVLDKTKVKETFGITVPYWRDSLEDCIARMEGGGLH